MAITTKFLTIDGLSYFLQKIATILSAFVSKSSNETITGIKTFNAGMFGGVVAMGTSSAIDVTQGSFFVKTITANTTLSFVNAPSSAGCCVTLVLGNGGNYTVTWPSSVKWSDNTPPTLTQNGSDALTFITVDGGTTWYGALSCVGIANQ